MALIDVDVAKFFKLVWGYFKSRKKRKVEPDAFDDSLSISDIANGVIHSDLSIDFLFVIMIHNGGKKLRPHDFKYRSIVGGSYNHFTFKRFDWKNHKKVMIDFEYEMLIRKVKKFDVVDVSNNAFMDGGQMKTAIDFEGIKFKRYFYLHGDGECEWMAVAGTTASNEILNTINQKQALNVAINKIKNILLKY